MVQSDMARAIPLAIIGVATFVGGLLSFTLPETLNKKLPDTIEEADNFDRLSGPHHAKRSPRAFAYSDGPGQTAHPRSLTRAFAVR